MSHVNIFRLMTSKKGIVNIKLSKRPATIHDQTKNNPNSGGFEKQGTGVIIINTRMLIKALSN